MKLYYWYALILIVTTLTIIFAYMIPADSPFVFLNYAFGLVFVTFIPGYCLTSVLFAARENRLDWVEQIVLSVALSFGIAGLSGLFLGLSPIGISFDSIRLSLAVIVVILASIALARRRQLTKAAVPNLNSR